MTVTGSSGEILHIVLFPIGIFLIYVLAKLVALARKGYKGAIVLGALLAIFAPDPVYEKQCKLIRKAKAQVECAEESGDPPSS
ncbi:hypothetical protein Geob_2041 [Geotalea daltonii FRC-32]|uniref:Uncharacterized protein n=1 Tax=Geotalea daltonii (strain DSM 22248 / JCM 15807 / FRC-32) TaxID=316067 RepID=B9M8Q1_GEODF|nr:hypothetical protein Geob_2041 [Geotalea daltonii FRC-32]